MAVVFTAHAKIVKTNQLFRLQTGLTNDNVVGAALSDWIRPTDGPSSPAGRKPQQLAHVQVLRSDGKAFYAEQLSAKLVLDSTEELQLLLLYNTGSLQSRHLLQQFALTFLKDENLGVILLQPDFRVNDISPLACRVLGADRGVVIGRRMDEVFRRSPAELQMLRQLVIEEIPIRNHRLRWGPEENRSELLMDANLLRDEQGELLGAYVTFKDVSNLRSLEEQVQRSDRLSMIGQIAAGTAHEIRNPLTAIKGFLQMFKSTLREKGLDKEYGYTEIMLTEIDRINALVNEFLLLSKPKDVSYDLVELATVLREIMPIVSNEALLHGITVNYDAQAWLPLVVADREMLKQVFLNICKNGIEAMGEGGALTVSGRVEREYGFSRWVNIDIHDNGPGIPAAVADKIFDPFVTTKQNGTGLGLSVCQRIVHDLGGVIRVSSKGGGTTFTVSLPCSVDAAHSSTDETESPRSAT
ncbi:PAS domain-containing protein [Paenibacillus sp. IB182496]|uniref:histidine kinase n=2 Tax=Paenibacillus sabuli TaxID=2772509 RepID=A0A927BU85_9BACL|nr:PAS domain-containing protein [Paenibacillus sabuli]